MTREGVEILEVLLVGPELGGVLLAVRVVGVGGEQRRGREHGAVVRLGVDAANPEILVKALDGMPERGQLLHHRQPDVKSE